MPSSIIPANVAVSSYQVNNDSNNNDAKQKETIKGPVQQFEDGSGDLPENDEKTVEEQLEKIVNEKNKRLDGGSDGNGKLENSVEDTDMNSKLENVKVNKEGGIHAEDSDDENMDSGRSGDAGKSKEQQNEEKKKSKDERSDTTKDDGGASPNTEKSEQNQDDESEQTSSGNMTEPQKKVWGSDDFLPTADQSEILKETTAQNGAWSTQATESENEKKSQENSVSNDGVSYKWKVCNTTAGPDYIPCLDDWQVIRRLPDTKHFEHRERHCPGEAPTCLVPVPKGYKISVPWPKSRDKVCYLAYCL